MTNYSLFDRCYHVNVVHLLERSGRTEEANLAVGAITGFMLALALGASASIAEGGMVTLHIP